MTLYKFKDIPAHVRCTHTTISGEDQIRVEELVLNSLLRENSGLDFKDVCLMELTVNVRLLQTEDSK